MVYDGKYSLIMRKIDFMVKLFLHATKLMINKLLLSIREQKLTVVIVQMYE